MIPLASFQKWLPLLEPSAQRYLDPSQYQAFYLIPPAERTVQLHALLEQPIAQFTLVNEAFFRARWAELLRQCAAPADLSLLEVATGDTDMIPQMQARDYPHSTYHTANMNQQLTQSFLHKTSGLPLNIHVHAADAAQIDQQIAPDSVDFIAFQHGVNDVLQAILCDQRSVDTIHSDWMETLPTMISILQEEIAQDTLAQHAKAPFLAMMAGLNKVLKPGGLFLMNHYMLQLDLNWGYPANLWENIIPMTRAWVKDLPGLREVTFDGFDPQWWLFLRRIEIGT